VRKVHHPVIASERSERGNPSLRLVCVDCRAPAAPSLAMTESLHSLSSFFVFVLAALLLMATAGCLGPTDAGTDTTISALDGGVTLLRPDGWEEVLPDEDEGADADGAGAADEGADDAPNTFHTVFSYPSAGLVLASSGREIPAVSVEISCIRLADDGVQYLEEAAGNYEMVQAAYPESGQFAWKDLDGTLGYYGLFNDAGDDGFLAPWIMTYLKSSSGEDMIVHVQFQVQKDWYTDNESTITQMIDSLRVHPPYPGDITPFKVTGR
jgi:hypothetical protein